MPVLYRGLFITSKKSVISHGVKTVYSDSPSMGFQRRSRMLKCRRVGAAHGRDEEVRKDTGDIYLGTIAGTRSGQRRGPS